MKKSIIKTTSVLLLIVMTIFSFCSCGLTEKTGGLYGLTIEDEVWWLESYAECVDGIQRLKSHGSTFINSIPVSYEGDLFDMKYCIINNRYRADKRAGIFVDPFDRKIDKVKVMCFAFFEDINLYDLERSYINQYIAYQIIIELEYAEKYGFNYKELTTDSLECNFIAEDLIYEYRLKGDNACVLSIKSSSRKNAKLSDEVIQAIIDSVDAEIYEYMQQ